MSYAGGKSGSGVYQTIINHIPPHDTYIEPFLGGGAILRHKKPAARSIGIDNDKAALEAFSNQAQNIPGLTLKHTEAFGFLSRHPFTTRDFIYCDPPYLHETRTATRLYKDELSVADHKRLLELLTSLPCLVMISGYPSALYEEYLADWHTVTFPAMTRSGNQKTEQIWFNYPPPVALHDYRYLGSNYRERERIKKKTQRWITKLENMPTLERQALLAAADAAWSSPLPTVPADTDTSGGGL